MDMRQHAATATTKAVDISNGHGRHQYLHRKSWYCVFLMNMKSSWSRTTFMGKKKANLHVFTRCSPKHKQQQRRQHKYDWKCSKEHERPTWEKTGHIHPVTLAIKSLNMVLCWQSSLENTEKNKDVNNEWENELWSYVCRELASWFVWVFFF